MSRPQWEYAGSVYSPKWHYTSYRDDTMGVELRMYTRRIWLPLLRNQRVAYFIDGLPKKYKTEEKLLHALAHEQKRSPARTPRHITFKETKVFAH